MKIITNWAGFFSNFLKYIAWTLCYENEKIIFHFVDTIEKTEKSKTMNTISTITPNLLYKENIWDIMFIKKEEYSLEDLNGQACETNFPREGYPSPLNKINNGYIYCNANIYRHEHFQQIREIYYGETQKLTLTPYIKEYIHKNSKALLYPEETIAVFIRFPGHYNDKNDNIYDIISEVEILLDKHNLSYIYLVTMVDEYIKVFMDKFKNKVIMFGNKRLTNIKMDWIDDIQDYKQESIDCFSEVYVASKCKFAIGASSNMLLGCLFLNPTMEFKIFDTTANSHGL